MSIEFFFNGNEEIAFRSFYIFLNIRLLQVFVAAGGIFALRCLLGSLVVVCECLVLTCRI